MTLRKELRKGLGLTCLDWIATSKARSRTIVTIYSECCKPVPLHVETMKMNEKWGCLDSKSAVHTRYKHVMHIEIDKVSSMFHANLSTSSHQFTINSPEKQDRTGWAPWVWRWAPRQFQHFQALPKLAGTSSNLPEPSRAPRWKPQVSKKKAFDPWFWWFLMMLDDFWWLLMIFDDHWAP